MEGQKLVGAGEISKHYTVMKKKNNKTRWYILENKLKKRVQSAYISINHFTSPLLQPCPQPLLHSLVSQICYSVIPFILIIYFSILKQCIICNGITILNTDCLISTPLSSWYSQFLMCFLHNPPAPPLPPKNSYWKAQYMWMTILTRTKIKANLGIQPKRSVPVLSMSWI